MSWNPLQAWKNRQAMRRAQALRASVLASAPAPSRSLLGGGGPSRLAMCVPVGFGLLLGFPFSAAWTWPFRWWATALHESCHALMAWLTGGAVLGIQLHGMDAVTITAGGVYPLISIAGYTGSALVGALLLRSTGWREGPRWALLAAALAAPELITALKGQWNWPWLASLLVGAALFWLGRRHGQIVAGFLAALLFWQTWGDIGVLVFHLELHSDARLLAEWCGAPILSLPIAIGMCGVCLFFWYGAFRSWQRALLAPRAGSATNRPSVSIRMGGREGFRR
jgi:hypothetical protein